MAVKPVSQAFLFLFFGLILATFSVRGAETDPIDQAALISVWNGFSAKGSLNWTTTTGLCAQYKVTCAGTKVVKLDLASVKIVGSISSEVGKLYSLTSLNLEGNTLKGSLPTEIGKLTLLTYLSLASNYQFSGSIPTEIANLPSLSHLNLADCNFAGPIPTEMGKLSSLSHLVIASHSLTGSIPTEMGKLSKLTYLSLSLNKVTGSIPTEIFKITSLLYLALDSPQLTGAIPTEMLKLTSLSHLSINGNLTGSIPTEIAALTLLTLLNFSKNQLTGSIPTEIAKLSQLGTLVLSSAQLTGSIPTEIATLTLLTYLSLTSNQLTGSIPTEIAKLSQLNILFLTGNLTGSIPTEIATLTLLSHLTLYSTQLTGSVPTEIATLTQMRYLYLASNQLTGSIPTEIATLPLLTLLGLTGNQLTGSIPTELGKLSQLTYLELQNNNLTGTIPSEIYLLPQLQYFKTDGNPGLCYLYLFPGESVSDDVVTLDCYRCNPCQQNSICRRGNPSFVCNCPEDFVGHTCQVDMNRCRSSPCLNGGICLNGANGFSCDCSGTGFSGTTCHVVDASNTCLPGYGKVGSDVDCTQCQPGSFGLGSGSCIRCQKGTSSNETAASSASACQICPKGTFSDHVGASTCEPCHEGKCVSGVGSFSASGFSSSDSGHEFNQTTFDSDENEITTTFEAESVVGYYYFGIYLGLILISGLLAILFRKRARKVVSPVAVVLKTPMSYMQVLLPAGIVTEVPSFFRGLVGTWVILGLVFVTLYQIHVFITQRIVEVSALQPGTVFKDGTATSKTSTSFRLSVVIHNTPITCDSSDFNYVVSVSNVPSRGTVSAPVACSSTSSTSSVILTSSSPEPLSFSADSVLVLQARSVTGTYVFNRGVSYELSMDSIDKRVVVMKETLVPGDSSLIGGNVRVDLSLTPTEMVTDVETLSKGYSYSHFISEIETEAYPSSDVLEVSFGIPVSKSTFFQVKKTEVISGLQFVVGLLALASGVITAGSLGANIISHGRKWKGMKGRSTDGATEKKDKNHHLQFEVSLEPAGV